MKMLLIQLAFHLFIVCNIITLKIRPYHTEKTSFSQRKHTASPLRRWKD